MDSIAFSSALETKRECWRRWASRNQDYLRERDRKRRTENREALNARRRELYVQNIERHHERMCTWRAVNPRNSREYNVGYYARNRGKRCVWQALRRAAKLNATPSWVDYDAIHEIYVNAAMLSMTVDHVVPLKGKNVCGLHVPWNLQLMSKAENSKKHNRHVDG